MTLLRCCMLFCACLALAARSTAGVDVSRGRASQFVVGQTTLPEEEAKLGPPAGDQTGSNGARTLASRGEHDQPEPLAFLPLACTLGCGSTTKVHEVDLAFGADQVPRSGRADNNRS